MHKTRWQFALYLSVGIICALIDIGLMQVCMTFEVDPLIAATVGFLAGLAVNFLLHTRFTFQSRCSGLALSRYLAVVFANYCLTLLMVWLGETVSGAALFGKFASLPLVAAVGYMLCRCWVYRAS
jgi:putative flippase GtrA